MNEEPQSVTQQLYQTLLNQNQVLAEIIAQQQILHAAVTGKNWEQVERTVGAVQSLSQRFSALEQERADVFARICPDNPGDIYEVSRRLPPVFADAQGLGFHKRRKAAHKRIFLQRAFERTFLLGGLRIGAQMKGLYFQNAFDFPRLKTVHHGKYYDQYHNPEGDAEYGKNAGNCRPPFGICGIKPP